MAPKERSKTRDAIVESAAELFHLHGVAATSVDQILAGSETGKSQLYYYFASKEDLVHEVVAFQFERYIEAQKPFIEDLRSWTGIKRWLDSIADDYERRGLIGGCPIGSLAAEMNDRDEKLRKKLAGCFETWESYLAAGLQSLKDRELLSRRADVAELAEAVVSGIQGGYLMATTKRDVRPMRSSVEAAFAYLRSHRPSASR